MNIKQFQYFISICEKKNLTAVASDFYISQQGLSSALKKMESELGIPLFERNSRGVVPNEYAEMILPHARQLVQEYQKIEIGIRNKKESESGRFQLNVNRIFLDILPVGTEATMGKIYPRIYPDISDVSESAALRNICDETADLALVSGPVDETRYARKVLNTYPYIALVKNDSPLAKKKKIFIKELENERIMTFSEKSNLHHNFVLACKRNGFNPNLFLLASDATHLLALCSDTEGIGIISSFYVKFFPDHLVKKIPIADDDFIWTIEFVYKKDRPLDNHVRLWMELYLKLAKEYFKKKK